MDDVLMDKALPPGNPVEKLPAEHLEVSYNWTEQGADGPKDKEPSAPLTTDLGEEPFNYLSWQFLLVFVSVSIGFYASFLGTINSWNGAQTTIPLMLPLDPLKQMLEPLDLPQLSAAANLTAIVDGLNLTKMATGVNTTKILSSLDLDRMFWGAVHTSLTEFLSGLNITRAAEGIDMRGILSGLNLTKVAAGLNLTELTSAMNLNVFVPTVVDQVPAAIDELKDGLWVYPTLIFAQILSSVFFGRLSDYVGRRWIFLFGNMMSFVAFLCVGRVNDGSKIAGLSALIGIGTGIQIMGPWVVLAELVPVHHRFTVTGLCISLLGPLLVCHAAIVNAFLTRTSDSWHWAYYVNAILSFLSLLGLSVSYFPPTYHQINRVSGTEPPAKDWLGLVVFTTFIALVSYALGWGKLIWVWSSSQVIVVITLGGTGMVGFWIYQYNFGSDHSAYPAYQVQSYRHVSQMILSALNSLMWLFTPLLQFILFVTVTPRIGMQGSWENTWGAGLLTGFLLSSPFLARPKHIKWHLAFGTTFGMIFMVGLRGIGHTNQYKASMALLFLCGVGHGYSTVVTYVTAPMTAHHRDLGLVVGLVSGYRGLLFAAARAVLLTIYINQILSNIPEMLPDAFERLGPVPQTITEFLDGLAGAQSTGSIGGLLDLRVVRAMTSALIAVLTKSWLFIISVAYVYFFIAFLYSLFSPGTDSYLSDTIYVRLNSGGLFRSKQRHGETF
ncbi:hypothetical protein BDV18DRAFT_160114 [Aspergillus unguis]